MSRVRITCQSCGQAWMVASSFSVYERQAVESCPCPKCGAYTLCCHKPAESAEHRAHSAPHSQRAAAPR